MVCLVSKVLSTLIQRSILLHNIFLNKHKFDGSKHSVTTKYFQNKGKYCSNLDPVDSNRLNVINNVGALDSIVNSDFHASPIMQ